MRKVLAIEDICVTLVTLPRVGSNVQMGGIKKHELVFLRCFKLLLYAVVRKSLK